MKTLKRVYFLFFQWHRSHIFLEMNTTLKSLLTDGHLDRRRPWPRWGLWDPRKPISGETFPFNRFLSSSIQHFVLELLLENSRWAPTSVKLSQNIIHYHFLILPLVRGWLERWHNKLIERERCLITVPLKKSVRLAFKRDEELFPDELQRTLLFSQVATTTLGHWSKETRISLPFEGKE